MAAPGAPVATHDGSGRVQLSFTVTGGQDRDVRVPPGVTVFDSASWNGIAIDSTCGGHGTCHKCKVQIDTGGGAGLPISRHDRKTFSETELTAGWRLACLATASQDLKVEVPPLTTRPKAATVGVGRQVILRPSVQKRYVELADPSLSDQRSDLVRLTDAIDDLELTVDLPVLRRLPKVLREADFKVTAVVVDEALIDVEPGDTTEQRYAIAFDLGTTTVVATLLDLGTRYPGLGRLPAEQAAALRRRRDHPDQRHDDGSRCARAAAVAGRGDPGRAGPAGVRRGWGRPRERLRGGDRRQRDDDRSRARHRSGTARGGAVRDDHVAASRRTRRRRGAAPAPSCPRGDVPGAGGLRRWRHRGRHARHRHGPGQAHPAVHRRRHQLRDRAQQRRHDPLDGCARGTGLRGWRDPVRHASSRGRHRGGEARPERTRPRPASYSR